MFFFELTTASLFLRAFKMFSLVLLESRYLGFFFFFFPFEEDSPLLIFGGFGLQRLG